MMIVVRSRMSSCRARLILGGRVDRGGGVVSRIRMRGLTGGAAGRPRSAGAGRREGQAALADLRVAVGQRLDELRRLRPVGRLAVRRRRSPTARRTRCSRARWRKENRKVSSVTTPMLRRRSTSDTRGRQRRQPHAARHVVEARHQCRQGRVCRSRWGRSARSFRPGWSTSQTMAGPLVVAEPHSPRSRIRAATIGGPGLSAAGRSASSGSRSSKLRAPDAAGDGALRLSDPHAECAQRQLRSMPSRRLKRTKSPSVMRPSTPRPSTPATARAGTNSRSGTYTARSALARTLTAKIHRTCRGNARSARVSCRTPSRRGRRRRPPRLVGDVGEFCCCASVSGSGSSAGSSGSR